MQNTNQNLDLSLEILDLEYDVSGIGATEATTREDNHSASLITYSNEVRV